MSQVIAPPTSRHRQPLWSLLLANRLATLGLTFGVLYGLFRQLEFDVQRQFAVLVASPA